MDLQNAVDELQESAVADGLVARLGQDLVQAVMAQAFATVRRSCRTEPNSPEILFWEQQRTLLPTVASSRLSTAKYLINQNDPERLRGWLAKHTHAERIALLNQLRENP